jgi:subtilase family serine protease
MRRLLPLVLVPFASLLGCGEGDFESVSNAVKGGHKAVCEQTTDGAARCHAHVVVDQDGEPMATAAPSGFGPADLQAAYGLPPDTGALGSGPIVAIVDAYDHPNAEKDLNAYRAQFGLGACTTGNGCFKKVNQNGVQGSYPKANTGWAGEIALDIEMVSALCPSCKILLVEAKSAYMTDLGAAVKRAVTMGAVVVSNSYGAVEGTNALPDDQNYFRSAGAVYTVSSGDNGYRVECPACGMYVTAVGGTTLVKNSSTRGWSETAWSGAGSGCSTKISKPAWQHDSGCAMRTVADVSAVADPVTGVAVYFSYGLKKFQSPWVKYGGTSVAAPVMAAIYARGGVKLTAVPLAGTTPSVTPYDNPAAFNDVVGGSNGTCTSADPNVNTDYLCTAVSEYDGPTGLGTPKGVPAL